MKSDRLKVIYNALTGELTDCQEPEAELILNLMESLINKLQKVDCTYDSDTETCYLGRKEIYFWTVDGQMVKP